MKIVGYGIVFIACFSLCAGAVDRNPIQDHQDECLQGGQILTPGQKAPEISAPDLLSCITHCNDVMVVNVLGKRFWEDARIRGSVCAPLKDLEQEAKKWNKNQKIVVYCACKQCDASAKAYRLLKSMGFKRVLAYEGGIREWYRMYNGRKDHAGRQLCEGPCKYEYLRRDDDNRGEEKAQ